MAVSDCERCRDGMLAQPSNTVSSLAYVVAGGLALRAEVRRPSGRRSEEALAWATIAAGLGSVAYHGPGTYLGRYLHDAGVIAMLGFLALADVEAAGGEGAPTTALAALPLTALLAAAHPTSSLAAQVVAGAAATAGEVARVTTASGGGRPWRRWAEVLVASVGVAAHLGGRSGGPWCRPDALTQPHALWHAATAGAIWLRRVDLDWKGSIVSAEEGRA